MRDLTLLEKKIGYSFKNRTLLELSLTHSSCGSHNNERLEFLGDSILNTIITKALYAQFTQATEGQLTRLRAKFVRKITLAQISHNILHLSDFIQLGPSGIKNGLHHHDAVLADAVESLIAAIYLDSDQETCQAIVLSWYSYYLKTASIDSNANKDPKTQLQEWLQASQKKLPQYRVLDIQGKSNAQHFLVECQIELYPSVIGEHHSRRGAEQNAARKILQQAGMTIYD
ncbi:MAG: ribonuclease III [Endozoicomonadaceae bacterium]|nr:ribonuclease III [Endozoicomonadaceae bacterium]